MSTVIAEGIAMGEAVATGSAVYPSSTITATAVAAVTALRQQDAQWPDGLCSAIADSVAIHPLRVVIMDNSGSMGAFDGRKLQKAADGTFRTVRCDRWEELK